MKDARQDFLETVRCRKCGKKFDIHVPKEMSAAQAIHTWQSAGSLCPECWQEQRDEQGEAVHNERTQTRK